MHNGTLTRCHGCAWLGKKCDVCLLRCELWFIAARVCFVFCWFFFWRGQWPPTNTQPGDVVSVTTGGLRTDTATVLGCTPEGLQVSLLLETPTLGSRSLIDLVPPRDADPSSPPSPPPSPSPPPAPAAPAAAHLPPQGAPGAPSAPVTGASGGRVERDEPAPPTPQVAIVQVPRPQVCVSPLSSEFVASQLKDAHIPLSSLVELCAYLMRAPHPHCQCPASMPVHPPAAPASHKPATDATTVAVTTTAQPIQSAATASRASCAPPCPLCHGTRALDVAWCWIRLRVLHLLRSALGTVQRRQLVVAAPVLSQFLAFATEERAGWGCRGSGSGSGGKGGDSGGNGGGGGGGGDRSDAPATSPPTSASRFRLPPALSMSRQAVAVASFLAERRLTGKGWRDDHTQPRSHARSTPQPPCRAPAQTGGASSGTRASCDTEAAPSAQHPPVYRNLSAAVQSVPLQLPPAGDPSLRAARSARAAAAGAATVAAAGAAATASAAFVSCGSADATCLRTVPEFTGATSTQRVWFSCPTVARALACARRVGATARLAHLLRGLAVESSRDVALLLLQGRVSADDVQVG